MFALTNCIKQGINTNIPTIVRKSLGHNNKKIFSKKSTSFSVDRTSLCNTEIIDSCLKHPNNIVKKEAFTPLAKELTEYIKQRGPITLHEFISQVSNHVVHGYYQQYDDKIGKLGDFTTSPEISQVRHCNVLLSPKYV